MLVLPKAFTPMIKLPSVRRVFSSIFGRVDTAFRVMAIGLVVAAVGAALGFALGTHTTGPLADAAVYLTVSGIAVVFVAGSLRFLLVALRLWRRTRE